MGSVFSQPMWFTIGSQVVVLLGKVVEPLGSGVLLEVAHCGGLETL